MAAHPKEGMNPMARIRVFVVDDHPIVRHGICSLLNMLKDVEVVGEADSPPAVLTQVERLEPDIVLLDIRLGDYNGLQIARQLRRTHPDTRVIVLTSFDNDEYLFEALEVGAHAYLLKDTALDDLPAVIRAVHAGRRLLSPVLMDHVLAEFQHLAKEKNVLSTGLTSEERTILLHMADGMTNREIAAKIHYSEPMVKKKFQDILEKLGVVNRTQAVALAIRRGLI